MARFLYPPPCVRDDVAWHAGQAWALSSAWWRGGILRRHSWLTFLCSAPILRACAHTARRSLVLKTSYTTQMVRWQRYRQRCVLPHTSLPAFLLPRSVSGARDAARGDYLCCCALAGRTDTDRAFLA